MTTEWLARSNTCGPRQDRWRRGEQHEWVIQAKPPVDEPVLDWWPMKEWAARPTDWGLTGTERPTEWCCPHLCGSTPDWWPRNEPQDIRWANGIDDDGMNSERPESCKTVTGWNYWWWNGQLEWRNRATHAGTGRTGEITLANQRGHGPDQQ